MASFLENIEPMKEQRAELRWKYWKEFLANYRQYR